MRATDSPRVLERVEGRLGELALRGDGRDFEVISNGVFPDGHLTIWSAGALDGFTARLRDAFGRAGRFAVEVPRGEPDVVYAAWRD